MDSLKEFLDKVIRGVFDALENIIEKMRKIILKPKLKNFDLANIINEKVSDLKIRF